VDVPRPGDGGLGQPIFSSPGRPPVGGGGGGFYPPPGNDIDDSNDGIFGDRFPSGRPEPTAPNDQDDGFYDDIYGEPDDAFQSGFGQESPSSPGTLPDAGRPGSRPSETPGQVPPFGVFLPEKEEENNEPEYLVLPDSLFNCPAPGFYPFEGNCKEFYVCQEVLPGKLVADQLYRCPRRYLFDDVTRRCQREHKVTCNKFELTASPKAGARDVLVVLERFIGDFFSTPLGYEETRRRFGY